MSAALDQFNGTLTTPAVSCESRDSWSDGAQLLQTIKDTSISGVSGEIGFDKDGIAIATAYDVMNFRRRSFHKVGGWDPAGIQMGAETIYLGGGTKKPSGFSERLTGYHIRVGIVAEPPIAMQIENCTDTTSPTCWYGWNPDIITRLARDLNFTYSYHIPDDKKWGGFNEETQVGFCTFAKLFSLVLSVTAIVVKDELSGFDLNIYKIKDQLFN